MIRGSSLIALCILLFPINHLLAVSTTGALATLCSYYDEFAGVVAMLYVTMLLIQRRLDKRDSIIYAILMALSIVGFVSNLLSGLTRNFFAIIVDAIFLWKPIACFLAFKNYATRKRGNMLRVLFPWAKFIIVLNLFLAVLGQVIQIGVTRSDGSWFGKTYVFFWDSTYQTAWLIIGSLLIISAAAQDEKVFKRYFFMSIIPLFWVGASLIWGWLIIAIMLMLTLRDKKVFKKRYLFLIAAVFLVVFSSEVTLYLLNDRAPRAKLLQGAVKVANDYFPFGSGFATYGSEMASRYYSKLYIAFGWENSWGLGTTYKQYLNDNFFACIAGQFGWFGLVIYLILQLNIINAVNTLKLSRATRAMAMAAILILIASMIGSASSKSTMGVFMFSVLGLISADDEATSMLQKKQDDEKRFI